jgi:hypothetical protein
MQVRVRVETHLGGDEHVLTAADGAEREALDLGPLVV